MSKTISDLAIMDTMVQRDMDIAAAVALTNFQRQQKKGGGLVTVGVASPHFDYLIDSYSGMGKQTHAAVLYIINLDEYKKIKAELKKQEDEIEQLRRKAKLYDEVHTIVDKCYEVDDNGEPVNENEDLSTLGERIASKFGYL